MKSRTSKWFTLGTTMVVAVVTALVGCSQSPTQPTAAEPKLLTRVGAGTAASLSPVNLYTESVISSRLGGSLTLLDVVLTVPAGAVKNDTTFSISIPDNEVFFNEFGTNGLVFDVPVTVTMSYRNADMTGVVESHIKLAWLDQRSNTWKSMDCVVDTVAKTVTGNLYHFSAYGLISD
jgi:hypothetical protein